MHDLATPRLRLRELIAALSHALDITEGQPRGHCVRACWIGMHVGREIGLPEPAMWELYYTLLLKDLGCSSNAARICELYLADDLSFKRDFKQVGDGLPAVLGFVLSHTGRGAALRERIAHVMTILRDGKRIATELIATRCQRGADIARLLRFPAGVADGIYSLDEHFDGHGKPHGLRGDAIPVASRIALLSQVVDVFHSMGGPRAAQDEIARRAGTWFDPALVRAFAAAARAQAFWERLAADDVERAVLDLEPAGRTLPLDDDYLDDIAEAFGMVVDSKSPYTSGHSARVALYTDLVGETLGIPDRPRRALRRAALLHDLGKLGVSNAVLDKPGKLDAQEWAAVREHAAYTEQILSRIDAFGDMARIAGAHHERLDGGGYPRGLREDDIRIETRIITVADIFDALSAERPYRAALPAAKALEMMRETVGSAIDAGCYEALRASVLALEQSGADAAARSWRRRAPSPSAATPSAIVSHVAGSGIGGLVVEAG